MSKICSARTRRLALLAWLIPAGAMLSSCATPVGRAQNLQGGYWQNAIVTNPDGNGPQVVRWGPPQNYNPSGRN